MNRKEVLQLLNINNPQLNRLLTEIDRSLYDVQEIPDNIVQEILDAKEKSAQPKAQVKGGEITAEQETIQSLEAGDRAYGDVFSILRNQGIQRGATAGVLSGQDSIRAYIAGEAQSIQEIGNHLIQARARVLSEVYENHLEECLGELGITPVTKTMGEIASSIPKPVKPCLPSSYLNKKN